MGKTEVVSHDLNPLWPRVSVKLKMKGEVTIKCFDYDFGRNDDLIGEVCLYAGGHVLVRVCVHEIVCGGACECMYE